MRRASIRTVVRSDWATPWAALGCGFAAAGTQELGRQDKRYALVTMCIGVGQGIPTILERRTP